MPIYEYQCEHCHRTLEKRQKFSDPELTVCPFCGGRLEKMVSAPAVQFKGGGWYADGYGNKSAAKAGSASSESGSSGDSGSKSSESSPAASAASAPAAAASAPAASAPSGGSAPAK